MDLIVVGIDGSEESKAALRFAAGEARAHGARVRAVTVWDVPPAVYAAAWTSTDEISRSFEADARKRLDDAVAATDCAGIELQTAVLEGQPAGVLLHEAEQADLLVVGSRGMGGFRGLLLGSVSQQCAQHSPCPIAILPRDATATGSG